MCVGASRPPCPKLAGKCLQASEATSVAQIQGKRASEYAWRRIVRSCPVAGHQPICRLPRLYRNLRQPRCGLGCPDETRPGLERLQMRVACVGGGPAGLYLAILMKRLDQNHHVTVLERKPEHRPDGWGVVFWDNLLDDLRSTDPETALHVAESAVRWHGQHLVLDGQQVEHEGGGYGIARSKMLDILTRRCDRRWCRSPVRSRDRKHRRG